MSDLEQLVKGWKGHFYSADQQIKWLFAEREVGVWLDPDRLLLLGILDAGGETNSEKVFGEWKTANPREKKYWKQIWRKNPQSLTYGVLARSIWPDCRQFTVRKAFKEIGHPTYDHAWFSYSQKELDDWVLEIINIAEEIRTYKLLDEVNYRGLGNWPVNYKRCFQYGPNYACPFFNDCCDKGDYKAKPRNAIPRISHLAAERGLNRDDVIVLDATRISAFLECRELYRRQYVDNLVMPDSEALKIGKGFHEQMGDYYNGLIKGRIEE